MYYFSYKNGDMKALCSVITIFLLMFPVISLPAFSKDKSGTDKNKYPSCYNPGIKVDGNSSDWPSSYLYCNFEAKVFYAATNDSSNLFLFVQILDPSQQMSLYRNGLTIYIDPLGKKKKDCSLNVKFRMQGPGAKQPGRPGKDDQKQFLHDSVMPPPNGTKKPGPGKTRAVSTILTTAGFKTGFNGTGSILAGDNEISAAAAIDSANVLTIEAKIPLEAFLKNPWISSNLTMFFETNIESRNQDQHMVQDQPGQMPDQELGDRPGGGHPEGGDMGGGGNRMGHHGGPSSGMESQDLSKTYHIWHKFSLANRE
jgi:hypothetical protein